MSRIGKLPVQIPAGVKAQLSGRHVLIEGPGGKLEMDLSPNVSLEQRDGALWVSAVKSGDRRAAKQINADFGTARALLNNMVVGVTKGWKKGLELVGVGYTATLKGSDLVLTAGYSHDVILKVPKEIKCAVTKNTIDLQSTHRELLGTFAAKIRKVRPPEPYLGKGIKYNNETIRRKAGKTGKK